MDCSSTYLQMCEIHFNESRQCLFKYPFKHKNIQAAKSFKGWKKGNSLNALLWQKKNWNNEATSPSLCLNEIVGKKKRVRKLKMSKKLLKWENNEIVNNKTITIKVSNRKQARSEQL